MGILWHSLGALTFVVVDKRHAAEAGGLWGADGMPPIGLCIEAGSTEYAHMGEGMFGCSDVGSCIGQAPCLCSREQCYIELSSSTATAMQCSCVMFQSHYALASLK